MLDSWEILILCIWKWKYNDVYVCVWLWLWMCKQTLHRHLCSCWMQGIGLSCDNSKCTLWVNVKLGMWIRMHLPQYNNPSVSCESQRSFEVNRGNIWKPLLTKLHKQNVDDFQTLYADQAIVLLKVMCTHP